MPIPVTIDRYEVLGRLGRGGMSDVYRCRDPHIGRTVAIKVLTVPEHGRFLQEARAAGTLRHKNIVTIFDYGEDDDRPFIVMEYVEGATVAEILERHTPLSLRAKLQLFYELATALDYAHNQGIVHRDIKPANLIVNQFGVLKILDFGIARVVESQLTQVGDVLGTPHYMAPEQIEGRETDRRTDIFAVGVTMYEVLSGRKAFPGTTIVRIAAAILNEQPPPLSQLCPEVDPALDRIVARAMQKKPSDRYATLESMGVEIAHVMRRLRLDGEPRDDGGIALDTIVTPTPSSSFAKQGALTESLSRTDPAQRSNVVARSYAWIAMLLLLVAGIVVAGAGALRWRTLERAADSAPRPTAVATPETPVSIVRQPAPLRADSAPPSAPAVTTRPQVAHANPPLSIVAPVVNKARDISIECDRGDVAKCVALGQLHEFGNGVEKDANLAATLYQRACDVNHGQGCNNLGLLYVRGNALARDEPRAAAAFQRACDGGYGPGCTNLGLMYVRAASVRKDDSRAAALFQRACDDGDGGGCGNLGHAQEFGLGVPKDLTKAAMSYQRGCAANNSGGCASLGWMYYRGSGIEKDEPRAVSLFERSCDDGNAAGCNDLAVAYEQGRGVTKDEAKAAKLYEGACEKNNTFACVHLGTMYWHGGVVPKDDARAVALYQQACDGRNAGGCVNVGFAYVVGRGVAKDEARAAGLYQRACDAAFADGCTRLATLYEQGRGVTKDSARAAALYQRGRDLLGKPPGESPTIVTAAMRPPSAPAAAAPPVSESVSAGERNGPVRVGGSIKTPTKIKDVRPKFPVAAQYARVQGVVIIEATIGADGKVTQTKVLRSIPLLDGAAEDAVKQWQFEPTIVNGIAVPIVMTVTVTFDLTDK